MAIKNLSQMKKYFTSTDAEIELIYSKYMPHKYLNVIRKVEKCQTNAVKFTGGSWLEFGKAENYKFNDNNTFDVLEENNGNMEVILTYRYL
jgi:hypothetical protein